MSCKIGFLWLFLYGIFLSSCEKELPNHADGRVFALTKGIRNATEIKDDFVIGEGEICKVGKVLPSDLHIVGKGLIYGTDSSMLKIQSHSYNSTNYNQYYGCPQIYTYVVASSTANVINIAIRDTMWKGNDEICGYGYACFGGYGRYACLLPDVRRGTKYYYRSFAHISDYDGFNKYVYGDVKEFISGGITQDPTVFIPIDALGIGVMKEDLLQPGIGLNAIRGCYLFNSEGGIGGYTDWQVPTIAQLREIYKLRTQIGGFKEAWYYSCEEGEIPYYYYWDFATNTQGCEQSNGYGRQEGYVRLVRPLP